MKHPEKLKQFVLVKYCSYSYSFCGLFHFFSTTWTFDKKWQNLYIAIFSEGIVWIVLLRNLFSPSLKDPPVYEASDGGLRAPASSVCTQVPWLSAAPAVASWYSRQRLSEWCPYSIACLWGIQETKIYSQSQLTSWPEQLRILYGPSEQISHYTSRTLGPMKRRT